MRTKAIKKTIKVKEPEIIYQTEVTKRIDESWDFRKANTKEYTHCFHSYPAMMIPQVARRLIQDYGIGAKLLFDPYCGTGTSLVEANLQGINAIGTDLNPLARLIAITKTTKINLDSLNYYINLFNEYVFNLRFDLIHQSSKLPDITNMDFWFSKDVQIKLGLILSFINQLQSESIRNFFKVAFSETVRESSFQKKGEFKLVKSKPRSDNHYCDVYGLMQIKLNRNLKGLEEFLTNKNDQVNSKVFDFNTVYEIPKNTLKLNSVDLVITSPPYGDSRTTVAYGQFSRLSSEWLGIQNANQIDNQLLGGRKKILFQKFKSEILNDVIHDIKKNDLERVKDVMSFYLDYEKSISNISKVVKENGFVCFVVGNRTVKGIKIPNDQITAELFVNNGFEHIETIIRNIPNKRMPLKNSPSNIAGQTSSTMKIEYIVICRKLY
jgi:tRNA G10  N-methylase Trm11